MPNPESMDDLIQRVFDHSQVLFETWINQHVFSINDFARLETTIAKINIQLREAINAGPTS